MATYTGTLRDFGLQPLGAGLAPRMVFIADQPAFSGSSVLVTRRIVVPIASNGSFSVELVPSIDTNPNVTYTMRIEWLDLSGGYIGMDILGGLVAALGGGAIGDMGGIAISYFWAGPADPGDPDNPLGVEPVAGMWWLNTDTGDLKEWI